MDEFMRLKKAILNVFAGIGMCFLLIFLNTRSGEWVLNILKIILDVIIVIIFFGKVEAEKKVALGVAALSVITTFMNMEPLEEFFVFVGYVLGGVFVLHHFLEKDKEDIDSPMCWEERNHFNPLFEKYSYSYDEGIHISKGFLKRAYINIPTTNIRIRIDQTFFQRLLGLCNVSFSNNYTGKLFGDEMLHNVKLASAITLSKMI